MNANRSALVLTVINVAILLFLLLDGRRMAQRTEFETLRVRAIELLDERGQVRAQLDVEESGEVVFRLRDEQGVIRVKMGASSDGSGLVLLNEQTQPGIQIYAQRGDTRLTLTGQGGEKQVIIEP